MKKSEENEIKLSQKNYLFLRKKELFPAFRQTTPLQNSSDTLFPPFEEKQQTEKNNAREKLVNYS